MKAIVQIVGADLLCRGIGTPALESRIDGASAPVKLQGWAARYSQATRLGNEAELFAIGREMFDWLNPSGWATAWARAAGPRELEIRVDDPAEPLARAVLEAPWELLARESGYLADDAVQLFELYRRVGGEGSPAEPGFGDLQLMFMAAAPTGENPLSFEAEESGILEATKRLPLHLVVEESGCAQFLGERLDLDGPFEALHLSCHGDIHPRHGPQLALEDETGQLALVDVGQLVSTLGDPQRMPLVFLSACRTAEQMEAGEGAADPFVRELVRAGVANVLGWDGSVYDADALTYARSFYSELASLQRVPRAAAVARHALRKGQIDNPRQGRHWHLARLYLGPAGGGALAAKGRPKRKPAGGGDQFLDPTRNEVPVASPAEFVGRRRATQAVLKAYRDGTAGVLIHGMGNLGKSSLAFRVSTRLTRHEKVVVFGKYDALSVLDRVVAALPPQDRKPAIEAWRNAVLDDSTQLADALEALLEGPLDAEPILLVVDDLERILETPRQSDAITPVQAGYRAVLIAILRAFRRAQSESRLLITSRYRFSLPDSGSADLAQDLVCVPLQPMDDTEREKQLRAAARIADVDDLAGVDTALLQRALDVAHGNPGLQAVLTRPILNSETAVAKEALAAIEHFQTTGTPPEPIRALIAQGVAADEANAMVAFFKRMAFDTYRAALTPEQAVMLQACCLFSAGLPIPRPAVEAAGQAAGVANPKAALDRLLGLGLVDDWGTEGRAAKVGATQSNACVAANPLARPLAGPIADEVGAQLAANALLELDLQWRDEKGCYRQGLHAVEVVQLALKARSTDLSLLEDAAIAAGKFLISKGEATRAYSDILDPARKQLNSLIDLHNSKIQKQVRPPFSLVTTSEALQEFLQSKRLSSELMTVWSKSFQLKSNAIFLDPVVEMLGRLADRSDDCGGRTLYKALRLKLQGKYRESEEHYMEAAEHFLNSGRIREWAICRNGFCDALEERGELKEALRISRGENLPVFEKLSDARSQAQTLRRIGRILEALGDSEESLTVRRDIELPAYKTLGDMCARLATLEDIQRMLYPRVGFDEALRLNREEALSVFEKLGEAHKRIAVLRSIADTFKPEISIDHGSRGPQIEHFSLSRFAGLPERRVEALSLFLKLGDLTERGKIVGKIAETYEERGDFDEALRIRCEEELPVLKELGDDHSLGVSLAKIADIFQSRGEFDAALAKHEERLAIATTLGDCNSLGHIRYARACIRLEQGDLEHDRTQEICADLTAALEILQELERPDGIAEVSMLLASQAPILVSKGKKSLALQVLDSSELAFRKLCNDHGLALIAAFRESIELLGR